MGMDQDVGPSVLEFWPSSHMFRAVISLNLYVNLSGVGKYVVTRFLWSLHELYHELYHKLYIGYILSYAMSYAMSYTYTYITYEKSWVMWKMMTFPNPCLSPLKPPELEAERGSMASLLWTLVLLMLLFYSFGAPRIYGWHTLKHKTLFLEVLLWKNNRFDFNGLGATAEFRSQVFTCFRWWLGSAGWWI